LALIGLVTSALASLHAEDTPPMLRKDAELRGALRSLQDRTPPSVTQKGAATEVSAQDGNTVRVGPDLYRLWGIAAPGMEEFGGYSSRQGLSSLLFDAAVACTPTGRSINGVAVARCKTNGQDLSAAMVSHGWARDCPGQSQGTYAELERRTLTDVAGGIKLPPECLADN
jgi:endonuclease YncB( thermonuclease family)